MAYGGGLQIALGADIRLCTPDARFNAIEIKWGVVPGMVGFKGSADFADCLHIPLATEAREQPLWTFDKGAAKVIGAKLLRTW